MSDSIKSLMEQLTLEEKVSLVAGHDMWTTVAIPRLGIPALKVTDGPNGARGGSFSGQASACFPCGSALAASWDVKLVEQVGEALADEVRTKGARMLLAPTVNIHRTVLAGRNFECFSEDPHLSARMAVAYVQGVQSQRVSVCIKHFVCNDQEYERMTISSELGDRALREIYLRPFEAAVREAGARGVMSAYNRIRGTYACENKPLLRDVLREEYGFSGVVVSDWFGTQSTGEALSAGLDLEMPGPSQRRGPHLAAALEQGEVSAEALDAAVHNLLELLEWTGALEHGGPEEEAASDPGKHRDLLRRASASSIVLLRNEGSVLPLRADKLSRIAILGPNADEIEPQGGGSAQVALGEIPSPRRVLQQRLGETADVVFERGCDIHRSIPALRCPAVIEYFEGRDLDGAVVATEEIRRLHFTWLGVPAKGVSTTFSARVRCRFTAEESGAYSFGLVSAGRSRLMVDDELVVDNWTKQESGTSFFGIGSKEVSEKLDLEAGRTYEIVVEYSSLPMGGLGGLTIGCLAPRPADMMDRAVEAARKADVALVFLGSNPDWESEGRDRKSMQLPGEQEGLIARVAEVNPNTIAVVNAGSPTAMEWAEKVPGVLQLWYPGQEGGQAIVDVLLGDADPGGRLPTTFPRRLEDDPAFLHYPGERGQVAYGEGIFVGYRGYEKKKVEPRFCFGHGLSYGEFSFGSVALSSTEMADGETLTATLSVKNEGTRAGSEVVQAYVADVEATVARPEKELMAFRKLTLEPGESAEVSFPITVRDLSFWDPQQSGWLAEAGDFELRVGRSSADIRSRATFSLPRDIRSAR